MPIAVRSTLQRLGTRVILEPDFFSSALLFLPKHGVSRDLDILQQAENVLRCIASSHEELGLCDGLLNQAIQQILISDYSANTDLPT